MIPKAILFSVLFPNGQNQWFLERLGRIPFLCQVPQDILPPSVFVVKVMTFLLRSSQGLFV